MIPIDNEPQPGATSWSPITLRTPSFSGTRGAIRFAFFAGKRRLLLERHGDLKLFDSGEHQIREVNELAGQSPPLEFLSQHGWHSIDELRSLV